MNGNRKAILICEPVDYLFDHRPDSEGGIAAFNPPPASEYLARSVAVEVPQHTPSFDGLPRMACEE
jgi:hypothetical protein